MRDIEPQRLMLPEERRDWERWQKRGRRRYVQFLTAILIGGVVLLSIVFSFVPDFGFTYAVTLLMVGLMAGRNRSPAWPSSVSDRLPSS